MVTLLSVPSNTNYEEEELKRGIFFKYDSYVKRVHNTHLGYEIKKH